MFKRVLAGLIDTIVSAGSAMAAGLPMDMPKYCHDNFGPASTATVLDPHDVSSWRCKSGKSLTDISLPQLCRQQYGGDYGYSLGDSRDASTWSCVATQAEGAKPTSPPLVSAPTVEDVNVEEARYRLDAANKRVLELSNLSPERGDRPTCHPDRFEGYVAKLNFDTDVGVIPVSVTIKEATGERTLVNVDTGALDQDGMVVKEWVVLGLQTLLREGQRVSLGVKLCGAAGRVIMLDSVR